MGKLNLVTCRSCGTIMLKMSKDVCEPCHEKEERAFLLVRDYLRQHPGASIPETAEATEVSDSLIQHFIATGRLERVGVELEHACQTCGKHIASGLICPTCAQEIQDQVQKLRGEISAKKGKGDKGEDDGFHLKKIVKT